MCQIVLNGFGLFSIVVSCFTSLRPFWLVQWNVAVQYVLGNIRWLNDEIVHVVLGLLFCGAQDRFFFCAECSVVLFWIAPGC